MRTQKYHRNAWLSTLMVLAFGFSLKSQSLLLVPDRVFDGENMHENWAVLVEGERIAAVGEAKTIAIPAGTETRPLPGCTLLPGLIEGHSHLFLHPYNETSWNDQIIGGKPG
jgi:imidazolonepropionase-like amidohydrolase